MTANTIERDEMNVDVVIVGGGPAGLASAIRLKQLALRDQRDISVCIVEKGAEIGAHLLSGAVLEPTSLHELLPDWRNLGAPLTTPVTEDSFQFLTQKRAIRLPTPPGMRNHGNYVISLGAFARWLASQAEALGVEIYPGFAAADLYFNDQGHVAGIIIGDMGINKKGEKSDRFTPGMILKARQTVLAEGCRGSLTKKAEQKFDLRAGRQPQTYGLGIKELWEIDPALHRPGAVLHSIGWPLDRQTYGGGWLYHAADNMVSVGMVVGLDYQNPTLSPFEEMQRFKTHPAIKPLFAGARRVSYGARALNEGGLQSLPKLTFPGGVLAGDSAGFLNVAKIKGNHAALKSGMIAAEALWLHFEDSNAGPEVSGYQRLFEQSWLWQELYQVRNIRPGFRAGLWAGMLNAALESFVLRGKSPWTLPHHADHETLKHLYHVTPITYDKPDGVLTFDRLSSVYLSNTNHEEDQPAHLVLRDPLTPIIHNLPFYGAPEQLYCPAGVYEIIRNEDDMPQLQINAQNCVHCKTCDIKDPEQNINWTVPEGGGGPNYGMM